MTKNTMTNIIAAILASAAIYAQADNKKDTAPVVTPPPAKETPAPPVKETPAPPAKEIPATPAPSDEVITPPESQQSVGAPNEEQPTEQPLQPGEQVGTQPGEQVGAQQETLTDSQIAAVVIAANNADIECGKLAVQKARNPAVKRFAEHMINDHTALNQNATQLAAKLQITPVDSEASLSIKQTSADNLSMLNSLPKRKFDTAYINDEINLHQSVLDSLDNTLIPSAQNPELKNMLVQARPTIEEHLKEAKSFLPIEK
jgi:putative membrane protein